VSDEIGAYLDGYALGRSGGSPYERFANWPEEARQAHADGWLDGRQDSKIDDAVRRLTAEDCG
jgi:hypothetical protein